MWYTNSTADYAPRAPAATATDEATPTMRTAVEPANAPNSTAVRRVGIYVLCTVGICSYFLRDRTSNTQMTIMTDSAAPTVNVEKKAALAYIERYATTAQEEQEKFGIPASIILAQGLVESNAGQSKLCVKNRNHFGIKCFSRKCKTGHCSNHTDDTHKDFFRIYRTDWESWRDHSRLLQGERYARFPQMYGLNYKEWAWGLQNAGYATHKGYALALISTIEKYNLNKYDQ